LALGRDIAHIVPDARLVPLLPGGLEPSADRVDPPGQLDFQASEVFF